MATGLSILTGALRLLQVKETGESLSADEAADGLEALNDLIDSWTNESLMQISRAELTIPFVSGKATYTLGPGGDIDFARTVSIENAFTRDNGGADWPIEELNNDQYQSIVLKSTSSSFPLYFFYRPLFPLAEITFWPVPGSNVTLFLNVRDALPQFTSLSQNIDRPPGHDKALRFNVAIDIAPEYQGNVTQLIIDQAAKSKDRIKETNNKNIPELTSDLADYEYDYSLSGLGGFSSDTPTAPVTEYQESGSAANTIIETGSQLDIIVESST